MNTLIISGYVLLISSFVLLLVIYAKLYNNFRRIYRERNEFLGKYLKSHYSSCNLLRTMNNDYKNFVGLLDETIEFVDDVELKAQMVNFRNNLADIQKTKLEKDLAQVEEFMTDYEIHELTHDQ